MQIGGQSFNQSWWKSFNRTDLNELVLTSLQQNFDVVAAVAILNQAQALQQQPQL